MTAAEARELTNEFHSDKVDSKQQMTEIQAAILAAATKGESLILIENLTKENALALSTDQYKLSFKTTGETSIKW